MKGPAYTFSPVNLFNAKLIKGAKASFSFNKNIIPGCLLLKGKLKSITQRQPGKLFCSFSVMTGKILKLKLSKKHCTYSQRRTYK